MKLAYGLCVGAAWMLACSGQAPPTPPPTPATAPAAAPEEEPLSARVRWDEDLVSRELLFGNPEKSAARISPDGRHFAFLAPDEGVLNVWVAPVGKLDEARVLTRDRKRGIRQYFWAYTSDRIVYLQDEGGDENWRAYSVRIDDGEALDLTPVEGVRAEIQEVSPKKPYRILVGLNDRDPRYHDLYVIDLRTGKRQLVQRNDEGYGGFITDDQLRVRFAVQPTPDGGQNYLIKTNRGFEKLIEVGMEDALTTSILGFDRTGRQMYMSDSRGRDTAALTRVRLPRGEPEVLYNNPEADLADVLLHPTKKEVQAAASTRARKTWRFFDPEVEADIDRLREVERGEIEIASRTLDDSAWTVVFIPDDGPAVYYYYDRKTKTPTRLFTTRPKLAEAKLARMYPLEIESRDGLRMVSYLTLPLGIEGERPPEPVPMVLFVHGGPWARSTWGYNPYHQWLSSRGYAVLDVNFRGSTGFGKSFVNAGNLEWAGKMHNDLIDAIDWAIKEGVADPDRIAIMGGSYGGYATLVGLTFTPKRFACGVDIVGPSNIVTLLEAIPPYWAPYLALFQKRVGDHTTTEGKEFLLARSPLTQVEAIERPLLIGQGANDPRVKQAESDQIVEAMKANEIPVTYVLYPDEGHGFARPENRTSFNAVAEVFLAACLRGKAEPYGDDFEGSSIQVPAGAQYVPRLAEALKRPPPPPSEPSSSPPEPSSEPPAEEAPSPEGPAEDA